jgi:hypothetical protein
MELHLQVVLQEVPVETSPYRMQTEAIHTGRAEIHGK